VGPALNNYRFSKTGRPAFLSGGIFLGCSPEVGHLGERVFGGRRWWAQREEATTTVGPAA
jgi:hypothetical protein